jgi:hypothetical protein
MREPQQLRSRRRRIAQPSRRQHRGPLQLRHCITCKALDNHPLRRLRLCDSFFFFGNPTKTKMEIGMVINGLGWKYGA